MTQIRDNARGSVRDLGIAYEDLTREDMARLKSAISRSLQGSGVMNGTARVTKLRSEFRDGRLEFAELRCAASHFDDREAITFNRSGMIGIAGWADDTNVRPFADALVGWASEISAERGLARDADPDEGPSP